MPQFHSHFLHSLHLKAHCQITGPTPRHLLQFCGKDDKTKGPSIISSFWSKPLNFKDHWMANTRKKCYLVKFLYGLMCDLFWRNWNKIECTKFNPHEDSYLLGLKTIESVPGHYIAYLHTAVNPLSFSCPGPVRLFTCESQDPISSLQEEMPQFQRNCCIARPPASSFPISASPFLFKPLRYHIPHLSFHVTYVPLFPSILLWVLLLWLNTTPKATCGGNGLFHL